MPRISLENGVSYPLQDSYPDDISTPEDDMPF